jgi:L-ascorbate metabolism protein UlaG (beta-lactamase superfamily)
MKNCVRITYIGHATLLIEIDGMRVLTDPLLRDRVGMIVRKNAPIDPTHLKNIDLILISHMHLDHFDPSSIGLVGKTTPIISPFGSKAFLNKKGFHHVKEMRAGDEIALGSLTIRATHAEHSQSRFILGPASACLGYVVSGSHSVYFAGDTDLFTGMNSLASNLDIALLPIWGWGPTLRGGHLTPRRAAKALSLLRPRLAVPIHWGTMVPLGMAWMNPRFLSHPAREFARCAAQETPLIPIEIISPGGSLTFQGETKNAPE